MGFLKNEDFEKRMKELEEQGIILKTPRKFMKDFFNIDIKDGKQEENMDKLDIIEIKILADLVADELERIYKKGKNVHERQIEFDLRMLLHKLSVIEKTRKE